MPLIVQIVLLIALISGFFLTMRNKKPLMKSVINCFSLHLEEKNNGSFAGDDWVTGTYRDHRIKCHAYYHRTRGHVYIIEGTPTHAIHTPTTNKVFHASKTILNKDFWLTFSNGQPLVLSKEKWLGSFAEFIKGETKLTPEKARDYLNQLIAACEQVERGDYTL